jgi:hypothetical protein
MHWMKDFLIQNIAIQILDFGAIRHTDQYTGHQVSTNIALSLYTQPTRMRA